MSLYSRYSVVVFYRLCGLVCSNVEGRKINLTGSLLWFYLIKIRTSIHTVKNH